MSLIDNQSQTMLESLRNALSTANRLDVLVGYFYLSGFDSLAHELAGVDVCVLVGMEIETKLIPLIVQESRKGPVDLDRFRPRVATKGNLALRRNYVEALVRFINDTDTFDDSEVVTRLDLFLSKIEDGSLKIRRVIEDNHSKMYLAHNRPENSQNGDFPGTRFIGSSNFTYNGLVGRGELNTSDRDKTKFDQGVEKFSELWSSSKSVEIVGDANKNDFLKEVRSRVWPYIVPSPYEMYIRVLAELFQHETIEVILTPAKITNGRYWDLEYQLDAIRLGMDRLNKFSGAILADVAGLGKSIVASGIARNLDMTTVIISPPHLIDEWEDYKEAFGIRGSKVFSSGKIEEAFGRYRDLKVPILLILDEAHRYRNEDTDDYQMLHQIARSHPDNKMLIITATPFNNTPKDIFALVKLFQTPGKSTIKTVEKLGFRFRELVSRYADLRREVTKGKAMIEIDREVAEIALEQRHLIEPIVIRRSRLDLKSITRYRLDLDRQGIDFAKVVGPELLEYPLGLLTDLYVETLDKITQESAGAGLRGARYRIANYIADRDGFDRMFGDEVDEADLRVAQNNLAGFMRRLLVTRFESSKHAFRMSLESMIRSNQLIARWWDELQLVPIMKKGQLPNPDDFEDDPEIGSGDLGAFQVEIERLHQDRGLICIPTNLMDNQFRIDLEHDIILLQEIQQQWFGEDSNAIDPKTDHLVTAISRLLLEMPQRKIIIFSMFADTVNYLRSELDKRGVKRVLSYTAANAGRRERIQIKCNFDASVMKGEQLDEFDVLIATDALSEGFNLHRAGVVINFDIPYNPTRVVQRIGRINRIDLRTFDEIHIYNSFPSSVGESEIHIKEISTLKIKLINSIVGSDHKTLTSDEEVASFFKDQFDQSESENDGLSWDAVHRENLDIAKRNTNLMDSVMSLPHRSRVRRINTGMNGKVVFGKKGYNHIFSLKEGDNATVLVPAERALQYFVCDPATLGVEVDSNFSGAFNEIRKKMFDRDVLPPIKGRRERALNILSALADQLPSSLAYCKDLETLIKELDDVNEGTLKAIGDADLKDLDELFTYIQELVPESIIQNCFERGKRADIGEELLLLAEEIQ